MKIFTLVHSSKKERNYNKNISLELKYMIEYWHKLNFTKKSSYSILRLMCNVCRRCCPFVLFLLAFCCLSYLRLRFMDSDYSFGIFRLLYNYLIYFTWLIFHIHVVISHLFFPSLWIYNLLSLIKADICFYILLTNEIFTLNTNRAVHSS